MIAALRALFWKKVLAVYGGVLGCRTRVEAGVKIYMTSGSTVRIGADCRLEKGVVVSAPDRGDIRIGDGVSIGEYSILSAREGLEIGAGTVLEARSFVVDFDHVFRDPSAMISEQGYRTAKVTIGKNVRIGAGAKILKGTTLGDGCVIAAGSVVTKDVPAFSECGGVPAAPVRRGTPS